MNGFHLTAGQKDYEERLVQMEEGVKQYYRQNGIPPGVPTQNGSNADPYVTGIALPNVPLGNYDVPSGWPTNVKFNEPGDVPGPPVQFESDEMGYPGAGYGFESDHTYEGDWFFFHTDHLGSTSYLTDTAGNVSQFVCYTPYGEAIVDEHLTTYENPFKFSGKELDDITGLYDHGARNRNPITAVWYGIDELFEKYPENGPYSYCGGNPVKFVDMDGRKWIKREVEGVVEIYYDRNVKSQKDISNKYGSTVLSEDYTYKGYQFYTDGSVKKNGEILSKNHKYIRGTTKSGQKYNLFVGTSNNCVNPKTLHKNMFGTSYTGGNNPMNYDGVTYNYDYQPYNSDEYGSIAHDHAYDKENVKGASGFFCSLNPNVIEADRQLAIYNGANIFESNDSKTIAKSYATYCLASFIYTYKSISKFVLDIVK